MSGMKCVIIHYTPLVERMAKIREVEFPDSWDRIIFTELDLERSGYIDNGEKFSKSIAVKQIEFIISYLTLHIKILQDRKIEPKRAYKDQLRLREYQGLERQIADCQRAYSIKNSELTAQHKHALNTFLGGSREYLVVLEDDFVLTCSNSELEMLNTDAEMLACHEKGGPFFADLSSSLGLQSRYGKKYVYRDYYAVMPGQTRCSSAYMLNRLGAEYLLSHWGTPMMPIDWHLSYLGAKLRIGSYWKQKGLFAQGSQLGTYDSNAGNRENV